jgi:hypothetical protein
MMVPSDFFHVNTKNVAHLILHQVGKFQNCDIFLFSSKPGLIFEKIGKNQAQSIRQCSLVLSAHRLQPAVARWQEARA